MGRTRRKRKTRTKRALSLNNNLNIINLLKTLKTRNWANETQLELRDFPFTGRGVSSKINIPTDAILIKVPITAMITLATFNRQTFNYLRIESGQQLSIQTLLALFLCIEKHKGAASEWKFYLDSLPSCNPLTWLQLTPSEVSQFPEHVAAQMKKFCIFFNRSWDSAVNAIDPTLECGCCNEFYLHRVITVDLFAWCYSMINSRGVYINADYICSRAAEKVLKLVQDEPNIGLCPFLDMFNHSTEAKTTPGIMHEANQDYYVLRSERNQKPYQQIFISYGAHDNVKLFVEYGFYIPKNPFDTWPIAMEDVCRQVEFNNRKTYKYAMSKGFNKDLYLTASGELSFNLKALLFVSICKDFKELHRVYRDDYKADEIDYFLSIVRRLMYVQLTLLTSKHFDDTMTHFFHEYLINFPICVGNKLRGVPFNAQLTI